jgi:hypothetical protein
MMEQISKKWKRCSQRKLRPKQRKKVMMITTTVTMMIGRTTVTIDEKKIPPVSNEKRGDQEENCQKTILKQILSTTLNDIKDHLKINMKRR